MKALFPIVKFKKGENVWVSYARKMVFRRNNCLNLVVTGSPGSGKSWALLSYFSLLDPDFRIDNNFFFRARHLIGALKSGSFKAGTIWGYDEAGIDANNLKYFDIVNQGLNALFQTVRHRNYIFGLSLPFLNMLSKGVRTLMTAQWECEGWIKKTSKTRLKPYILQYNGDLDKFYRKRLVVVKGGDISFCNKILLPKPPKRLVLEYEKVKKEFTQDLYNDIHRKIVAFDEKEKGLQERVFLTDKEEVVLSFLKEGLTAPEIVGKVGGTLRNVYSTMQRISSKGVVIKGLKGSDNKILRYEVIDKRD